VAGVGSKSMYPFNLIRHLTPAIRQISSLLNEFLHGSNCEKVKIVLVTTTNLRIFNFPVVTTTEDGSN